MGRFLVRRVLLLPLILLVVTFATFALVSLAPGDPARTLAGGIDARPEDVVAIRQELHLDEPLLQQYGRWLGGAVQLDLGTSLYSDEAVLDTVSRRFPVTLGLALAAVAIAVLIGLPLGLAAGVRPATWSDRGVRTFASMGFALPNFWLGILLVVLFGVQRSWLPVSGYVGIRESVGDWVRHIFLPALTLGYSMAALIARQLRAEMMDVLEANHVRAAWARGERRRSVIGRHGLRNASIPLITTIGLQLGQLLGGAVIIEQVFAIPGLGTALISAVFEGDLPVVLGVVVTFAVIQVVLSIVMDVGYALVNPKIAVA